MMYRRILTFEGIVMLVVLRMWAGFNPPLSRKGLGDLSESLVKSWGVPLSYAENNFNHYLTYNTVRNLVFFGLVNEDKNGRWLSLSESGAAFLTELEERHGHSWVLWPIEVSVSNTVADWSTAVYVDL